MVFFSWIYSVFQKMIFQLLSLGEGAYMIGVVGTYLGK
jgi:hypothetical protein